MARTSKYISLLLISVVLLSLLSVFSVFSPAINQAKATGTLSDVVVKDIKNNEICSLNAKKTSCDLSQVDAGAGTLSVKVNSDSYEVTLSNVVSENAFISADDPITIKSGTPNVVQKLSGIVETESSASITIEEGKFELNSKSTPGIEAAGRLILKKSADVTANGKSYGVRAISSIVMDESTSLSAMVLTGSGSAILAGDIQTNKNSKVVAQNSPDNSEATVAGISTNFGGNITFKETDVKVTASTGISTFFTGFASAGDLFINGGNVSIQASAGDAIAVKNITTRDHANLDIKVPAGTADNSAAGIGVIYKADFNKTELNIWAPIGIISNNEITVNEGSKVLINDSNVGIVASQNFEITDVASINVAPIEDVLSDTNLTVSGAYFGHRAYFSILDEEGIIAKFAGKLSENPEIPETDQGAAIKCGGVPQVFFPSSLPVKGTPGTTLTLNTETSAVTETPNAATSVCEFDIDDTSTLSTPATSNVLSNLKVLDPESGKSVLTSDGTTLAELAEITPVPVLFYVKLSAKYPTQTFLVTLLIIIFLFLIIFTTIYKLTHKKALFILNLQNDMMDNGPMKIEGGLETAELIDNYLSRYHKKYKKIYMSRNWFEERSEHFNKWPKHCIKDTQGAKFVLDFSERIKNHNIIVVNCGDNNESNPDGYNIFDGAISKSESVSNIKLADSLKNNHIRYVNIVGFPLEYSILKSGIAAAEILGNKHVSILTHLTAAVNEDVSQILEKLKEKGVKVK